MEDKGYLVRFVSVLVLDFPLLPGEGVYGSARFSEVSALSQMGEAPRKHLSASVNSQWPSAQNTP